MAATLARLDELEEARIQAEKFVVARRTLLCERGESIPSSELALADERVLRMKLEVDRNRLSEDLFKAGLSD